MSCWSAVIAVLAAALCFATTGTAQAVASVDASALSIGAARIVIGGGLLGVIAAMVAARGRARRITAIRTPRTTTSRGIPVWCIVAVGAAGVVAYQPTFFTGTRLNGVAVGTVLALGSAPVFTGVLDMIVRRRRPTRRWMLATAIALAGVVLVSGAVDGAGVSLGADGVAASLGAGMSYAVYAMASKLLLDRGYTPAGAVGAIFGAAAIASLPVLAATSPGWLLTGAGLGLALWLGIVTTTVAYLLFGWGLRRLAPTTVSTLTLAEPLGATVLGLAVLHERLTPASVVGLVTIAVGLAVLTVPSRTRAAAGRSADAAEA